MSITPMPVVRRFPAEKGQSKLVHWIENQIYRIVSRRINWMLNRVLSEGFEFIVEGNEPGDDGNLRLINSGGNFLFQKRTNGSWVDENEITTTSS